MKYLSVTVLSGLALLALTAADAQARPRDDALSGAFRCAAIGDTRTWLDCYYGAAQPVRSALGLQPVPQAQSRLVAQPPAGTPSSEDLVLRDQVMSQAVRCATLGDARQWLGCYYAAAQPVRGHLGLPGAAHAPAAAPIPSPATPQAAGAAAGFGMRALPVSPTGNANRVSSRMASYSFDKLRWFTVTLANGQVWKQIDGDTTYAHWKKPAGNYLVHVSHGFMGSFNLQVQGEPGLFKVHRIQ